MRICATRFRKDSNINTFAMHSQKKKRENNSHIQYKKVKYYCLKDVSIIFSHFFFSDMSNI